MKRLPLSIAKMLALALLLAATSCASYLKDFQAAQASFNAAAEAENRGFGNPEAAALQSPERDYRAARAFILKAMGDAPGESKASHGNTKLASDGLLLSAYNIRALSEWKLGLYREALQTASACRLTFERDASVKGQRDYVLMACMEALVWNDSVYGQVRAMDRAQGMQAPSPAQERYLMALRTGFRAIEEQRALLAPDHPLQSYLCISQLSIAKNWKDLVDAMVAQLKQGSSPKLADYKRDWTQEMGTMNQQLVPVFAALKASLGENGHGLYVRWKQAHADVSGI